MRRKKIGILIIFSLLYSWGIAKSNNDLQLMKRSFCTNSHILVENSNILFFNKEDNLINQLKYDIRFQNAIVSNNKQNVIVTEIIEGKENIEQKSASSRIKLYNSKGEIIAISESIYLYDWEVYPLGDDNTVIIFFPAGTQPKAMIKFMINKSKQLFLFKEIYYESGNLSIDCSIDGELIFLGISSLPNIHKKSKAILLDNKGNEVWRYFPKESFISGVHISPRKNFIVMISENVSNNTKFSYLIDNNGNNIAKKTINSKGNYYIEFSDNEKYFALCSGKNNLSVFNTNNGNLILDYVNSNSNIQINTMKVKSNGDVFATALLKTRNSTTREKEVVEKFLLNIEKSGIADEINIKFKGIPYLRNYYNESYYIEMITSGNKSFYLIGDN